ncbi:MAG: glutamate 5-kinase [Acidimicrobiia bacterium]|nr:glutamate 5-kinase [Acidimicrobiia bacterium]
MRSRPVIVKIGTSSLTDEAGAIDGAAVARLCADVAEVGRDRPVVIVTSGAIAAGLPALGLDERPRDSVTLQAASAVGQIDLLGVYQRALADHGRVSGQLLLAPLDFVVRSQYLHARNTLQRLLELDVVPVINENDAIADDEIRFGDNDRLAALVAHLIDAEVLVLLTDTEGVLTADPRVDTSASLIEEIVAFDHQLDDLAGGAGTARGSGGMASKLTAAKIAAWSGVRTVIASASRPGVLAAAVAGDTGVGTAVVPRPERLGARKLWIAFAVGSKGTVVVDAGARRALEDAGRSLLAAGVLRVEGDFDVGDAVEVADPDGVVFAKGLVRHRHGDLQDLAGKRTGELPDGAPSVVLHRDDLVMLP